MVCGWAGFGVRLDRDLMISGVYRLGHCRSPGALETQVLPRRAHGHRVGEFAAGPTNACSWRRTARPTRRWARSGGASAARGRSRPLGSDAATQTLLPLVTLAHAPAARTAAVIGYGSGMSSHMLLASPRLEKLVTIEIEPMMVEGARTFYPANRRVFDDPRSTIVLDDAKSYFASEHQRFDLILSEPSNPWVSGVSGLFTTEFYARIRRYLTDDGVFGQWLHTYELDDATGAERARGDPPELPRRTTSSWWRAATCSWSRPIGRSSHHRTGR